MVISVNQEQVTYLKPLFTNQELIIGIDSSKSNSGICVESMSTQEETIIEINGKFDGTSELDVLTLCKKERDALSILFAGSKPKFVGIENIITKDDKRKETGISVHLSRFKITAVFMSFISFFQDTFGVTPDLINNQAWKSHTLPEEFRKRDIGKGSLAYFKYIGSKYQYYSDDATDSVCIKNYLKAIKNVESCIPIDHAELSKKEHNILLLSTSTPYKDKAMVFTYNPDLDLEVNAAFIANRLKSKQIGTAQVETSKLKISDIYSYCSGKFKPCEPNLQLIVVLKE